MTERISREDVEDRLERVVCPCAAAQHNTFNIVEMGLVDSIDVSDTQVTVELRLTQPACFQVGYLQSEIEDHVGSLPDVDAVTLETDDGHEWDPEMMTEAAKRQRKAYLEDRLAGPGEFDGSKA